MKVCIIGAGIGGLCSARHALHNGLETVVFEQSEDIGGTWRYEEEVGTNKYGIEVHSSMYQDLRTNLPKEIMGFPDFPIPDEPASYITSENMLRFLNLYADKFSIRQHIRFLHYVIRVRPTKNNQWEVISKDLENNDTQTELFDCVMVANGNYHSPSLPKIEGMDIFKGRQMHSHDYRCPDIFKDENVLIIGAGPSGMDITHTISNVAKSVTLSHHLKEKPKTAFNKNVTQKPDVVRFTEDGAVFSDNTTSAFTSILYCTGFIYSFPFLSTDCGVYVEENCVKPLYKHIINIKNPTMAFIGLPSYACASQMMDLQARFALIFFSKKKPTPSQREMEDDTEKDMQKRWKMGFNKRQAHMMGPLQYEYFTDLAKTAETKNVDVVISKLYDVSRDRFLDDLINFRKDVFRIIDESTFVKIN